MTIYLDFDGTVVEHQFPGIGRCNYGCIEVIYKLQMAGHVFLLNTIRCEVLDDSLEKAIDWFKNVRLYLRERKHDTNTKFSLYPIFPTEKKHHPEEWNWQTFKKTGVIFIDDSCPGIPLKPAVMTNGKMVDWDEVDKQMEENGMYLNFKNKGGVK